MARVFLGMGSNLGDRRAHLGKALAKIGLLSNTKCVSVSSVTETPPLAGSSGQQGWYLNLVVEIETSIEPKELLCKIHEIEVMGGRERKVFWGPRTIDIDILLYDMLVWSDFDLTIPHPEMLKRDFVMIPLLEIAPDLREPKTGLLFKDMWEAQTTAH